MSNFLTNIRLNNLQQEIDNIVLTGPLTNPLLKNMDCGGFAVENAVFIEAVSIITPNLSTGGVIADSVTTDTITSKTSGGPVTFNSELEAGSIITDGVTTDTITSKTSGGPVTFNSELEAGTGDFSTSLRATSFTQYTGAFNQVSIASGGINCLTINTDNIASNSANPIQFQSEANFTSLSTGSLNVNFEQVNNVVYTPNIDSNPAYTPSNNGTVVFNANAEFSKNITIAEGGVITSVDPAQTFNISNVYSLHTNSITAQGTISTIAGNINATAGAVDAKEYVLNGGTNQLTLAASSIVDPTTNYPYATLAYLTPPSGPVITSKIYDSVFNPPPSVVASTLTAILANGSSAGNQKITDVEELDAGVIQGGIIQILPAGQSNIGNVFDTVYTPPSITGSLAFNDPSNISPIFSISPTVSNIPVMNFSYPTPVGTLSFLSDINLYLSSFNFKVLTVNVVTQYVFWIGEAGLLPSIGFPELPTVPISYFILNATAGSVYTNSGVLLSCILPSAASYSTTFSLYFGPLQPVTANCSIQIQGLNLAGQMIANFIGSTTVSTSIPE